MEKNVAMYIVFSRRQDFAEYFNDFFFKKISNLGNGA
jgi:hypothetical protein